MNSKSLFAWVASYFMVFFVAGQVTKGFLGFKSFEQESFDSFKQKKLFNSFVHNWDVFSSFFLGDAEGESDKWVNRRS